MSIRLSLRSLMLAVTFSTVLVAYCTRFAYIRFDGPPFLFLANVLLLCCTSGVLASIAYDIRPGRSALVGGAVLGLFAVSMFLSFVNFPVPSQLLM